MSDPQSPSVPELLSAVEARPLDERADGYLEVLERLRGQLEDPIPG
jgi:hypothetical protein